MLPAASRPGLHFALSLPTPNVGPFTANGVTSVIISAQLIHMRGRSIKPALASHLLPDGAGGFLPGALLSRSTLHFWTPLRA